MDCHTSGISELLAWAEKLGTTLSQGVEIYDDPVTGFSFRATRAIPSQTELVKCSYGVTMSYLNALDTPIFPRRTEVSFPERFLDTLVQKEPHIIGHFFLMQQYLLGENSFWWPYIRLLPPPDKTSSIPALWPNEDQRYLDGTNAEPAIRKRTDLWNYDCEKGIRLLKPEFEGWEEYSFDLYRWAASIFGSRSFRPSLTIAESVVPGHEDHFTGDTFSLLLPVMDIGNHNGFNDVEWVPDPTAQILALSSRSPMKENDQIFNYYGDKSNSELLVGYGFTLSTTPNLDRDVVNLRIKPTPDAMELRRSQHCYVNPREPDGEFRFTVQKSIHRVEDRRCEEFKPFSDGLVDLVICLVANHRERRYLSRHSQHCPERDTSALGSLLSRAAFQALQVLFAKLISEKGRIEAYQVGHQTPHNENQRIAIEYTRSQLAVLSAVIRRTGATISRVLAKSSEADSTVPRSDCTGTVSLAKAFDWLRYNHEDIHSAVVQMISQDQEEPLPLNWDVLVEDWDHTYWTVWIFTVWMLWACDRVAFQSRHSILGSWMVDMNRAYEVETVSSTYAQLYVDASEFSTINSMVQGIMAIPQFSATHAALPVGTAADMERIRNLASYVAHEECLLVGDSLKNEDLEDSSGALHGIPAQRLLFIKK